MNGFEQYYINLRDKEQRVFDIESIKNLPYVTPPHPYYNEWQLRIQSFNRFRSYFEKKNPHHFLDLACGNGWFINQLYNEQTQFTGVEINNTELCQAKEIHEGRTNVNLILADIFELNFSEIFDCITINAAIQYFPNFAKLINYLRDLLSPNGEIHILDSPFYRNELARQNAQQRSKAYFKNMDCSEMEAYYHHHAMQELDSFNARLLYDPNSLKNRASKLLGRKLNPFPWIIISKKEIA